MLKGVIAAFLLMVFVSGCIDNEESFYIEHVKVLPDFPDCEYSAGDQVAPYYYVDLLAANQVSGIFYVTNAVMVKNDYGNLVAESNGILVDGYDVYTEISGEGGGVVEGSAFFEYNHFIKPESSDVLMAQLISPEALASLKAAYCEDVDALEVGLAIINGDPMGSVVPDSPAPPETMQSVVRFLGHTQGGVELETQEFTFTLYTYCGPLEGWEPCFESPCYALCSDVAFANSCFPGVNAANTCAAYLSGIGTSYFVPDPTFVPGTGETMADAPLVDWCTANCGGT